MKLKTKLSTLLLGITSIFALTAAIVTNPNSGSAIEAKAEDVTYRFSISADDFNGESYAANNGSHTSTATSLNDSSITKKIEWQSNQVMLQKEKMQWQKSKGYICNTTDLGKISSVQIDSTAGSFTTYYGTSEKPSSGTTAGGGFFNVKVGSATGQTNSITVTFTISESSEPSISSVTINETNNIIKPSSSKTLTATVNADEGFTGNTSVTWSSSDETIATVNSSTGVVTGVKAGKATITATSVADTTKKDSVDVLVLNNSGLTAEDPFTSSEAVEVAKLFGTTASTQKYYVKGLVTSATYSTQHNNGDYKLDEVFAAFRISFNGPFKSVDDIKVGYYLTVYGSIVNYNNNTPETTQGADVIAIDKVSSLEITSAPSKLTYNEGESVDLSGLVITAVYESGLKRVITDYTYTPTGSLTTSTSEIIISYCGVTVSQAIVVNARIATSITITSLPTKTKYYTGTETLDTTGLVVTASYNAGDDADVTSECSLSDVDFSTAGTKTVTVTYKGLTATFNIVVVEFGPGIIADGKYFISTSNVDGEGKMLSASSTANTSSAPTADAFSTSNDSKAWTFTHIRHDSNENVYTIKCDTMSLYSINQNNGIRINTKSDNECNWQISLNEDGETYTISSLHTKDVRKLACYNNQDWRGYTTNDGVQALYLIPVSVLSGAETYAKEFLDTITCSGQGSITAAEGAWSTMETKFNALSDVDKETLASAIGNDLGTDIERCIYRYEAIIMKYGTSVYNDFMSRGIVSPAHGMIKPNIVEDAPITEIIVIASISAVTLIGLFAISKKRKEN